jgi:hypothetical protein
MTGEPGRLPLMFDWHWLLYDVWDAWDDFDLSINWGNVVTVTVTVTVTVGGLAAIGVIVTWQQKTRADKRSEWWRRTTWAFERTFSVDDAEAQLGWEVLGTLVGSTLATRDDSDIVQVIAEQVALGVTGQEDRDGNAASGGRPQPARAA